MLKRKFEIGDVVEVTHYTPGQYAPGARDELGTEALFRRIVDGPYRIMGFDNYGHIELHPTRHDWIWIGAEDVKLARARKKEKG